MKKILYIVGIMLVGCSTPNLIRPSDFTLVTKDKTKLWIANTYVGEHLYKSWKSGVFGNKTQVYLVDTNQFKALCSGTIRGELASK